MSIRSLINFGQALQFTAGVNVRMQNDGSLDISYCVLKKEKQWISIVQYKTEISTLELLKQELLNLLPLGSPIHINLEGKGILMKSTEENLGRDRVTIVRNLFPMVKPDEFVSQLCEGAKSTFVCLGRKDALAALESFSSDFSIVSFSLGTLVADQIIPLIKSNQLFSSGYRLDIESGKIATITLLAPAEEPAPFTIGDETVPASAMLAYASAWSLFFKGTSSVAELDWLEQNRINFQSKKALYRASRLALISLIIFLVLNSLAFFWLTSTTENLEVQAKLVSSQSEATNERQKQLATLQTAYDNIGWKSNTLPLYYADQIAALVTTDITLTLLEIGAQDEIILRSERRAVYQPTRIKVAGLADNPVSLRQWVTKIEALVWIKQVTDQQYNHDAQRNKGVFEFYIEVK